MLTGTGKYTRTGQAANVNDAIREIEQEARLDREVLVDLFCGMANISLTQSSRNFTPTFLNDMNPLATMALFSMQIKANSFIEKILISEEKRLAGMRIRLESLSMEELITFIMKNETRFLHLNNLRTLANDLEKYFVNRNIYKFCLMVANELHKLQKESKHTLDARDMLKIYHQNFYEYFNMFHKHRFEDVFADIDNNPKKEQRMKCYQFLKRNPEFLYYTLQSSSRSRYVYENKYKFYGMKYRGDDFEHKRFRIYKKYNNNGKNKHNQKAATAKIIESVLRLSFCAISTMDYKSFLQSEKIDQILQNKNALIYINAPPIAAQSTVVHGRATDLRAHARDNKRVRRRWSLYAYEEMLFEIRDYRLRNSKAKKKAFVIISCYHERLNGLLLSAGFRLKIIGNKKNWRTGEESTEETNHCSGLYYLLPDDEMLL